MSRGRNTTVALLTAAVLLASSPEVQAGKEKLPTSPEISKKTDRNPASLLARGLLKKIGGTILNIEPNSKDINAASSTNALGAGDRSVTIDTGSSLVPGSDGIYTIDASSSDMGKNDRLDRSDVDMIQITSGSFKDGGPLFSLRLYHIGRHWMNDPLFADSFYVRGSTIDESGSRVHFFGSAHPEFNGNVLDTGEVAATGSLINGVINEALNGGPTHLVDPPISPVQ